jgi:hypothetical protein
LNKDDIDNHDKCDICIYRSGEFEFDGWNGEGYKAEEIKLRQFK